MTRSTTGVSGAVRGLPQRVRHIVHKLSDRFGAPPGSRPITLDVHVSDTDADALFHDCLAGDASSSTTRLVVDHDGVVVNDTRIRIRSAGHAGEHDVSTLPSPRHVDVDRLPRRRFGSMTVSQLPDPGGIRFRALSARGRRAERCTVELRSTGDVDTVVALAAAGVPIAVESSGHRSPSARVQRFLTEIDELASAGELRAVQARRAAHSSFGRRAVVTEVERCAGVELQHRPTVSILLATRRPGAIVEAVGRAAQLRSAADHELIVGLHGDGFDTELDSQLRAIWPGACSILRLPATLPLGGMLNQLTQHADGQLLTKWDDDDWYGPDHVDDLVLAWDESGAQVVGKFAEFVYLGGSDLTIRRHSPPAEGRSDLLAGGTLLTSAEWLRQLGGWEPVPRRVDQLLLRATRANGGVAYRTHGYQYVLHRSHEVAEHTWRADEEYFVNAAAQSWPGLRLDEADIPEQR